MKQVHVMKCLVKRPPVCKPLYKVIIMNCMYVVANLYEMLNVIPVTGYIDLKIEVWLSYCKRLTAVTGYLLIFGTWDMGTSACLPCKFSSISLPLF